MKKLISVFAALALVGAVAAKPAPKKAPAKPAAPAVAAPAAPAPAAAAVAAAGKKDSSLQIGLFGGYNIHLASTLDGTKVTPANAGGIYGGADFLYGQAFKFGIGVAYNQTDTTSGATKAHLPIVAKIRYYFVPAIYAGINGGYGIDLSTKVSGQTFTIIPLGAELGYALDFGGVGLDIGAQFQYLLGSTKFDSTGTSISSTFMAVTPYLRVNFQF